jgi:ATP-binding cassette, subfamily F, member 3
MITLSDLYLQYGDKVLFDEVTLVIGTKDKVGLTGRNGAGKSTLLKIIAQYISPDSGNISRPTGSTLGYLHQDMAIPKGKTVLEETMTAFDEALSIEKRLDEINEELGSRTDYESDDYARLIESLSDLTARLDDLGGGSMVAECEKVLTGLGFEHKDLHRLTDEFSGGWQMRIELAKMLLQKPDYLLLDEPTNHLDIESIIWLENFLKTYQGAIILISHDRAFLNAITNRTIEIELGQIHDYKAPYDRYIELRKDRKEKQQSAFENQQKVIAQKERTINRFMAKASKTKMAQSMQKQLDKMERVELAEEDLSKMNLRFPDAPRSGQVILESKGLGKTYGSLKVLSGIDFKMDRGDRVAFVGQNGQGKTTLARMLIGDLTSTEGKLEIGHNVTIGYYSQHQTEAMAMNMTLLETMEYHSPPEMRTRLRNILGAFLFSGEDVDKKVSVLSGGERARLALASMLLRPFNLLVLDEPTNHLDMISKDILKKAIQEFNGALIVVSHDREFLGGLTNKTIEFRNGQIHEYLGDVNAFLEKRNVDNMREIEFKANNHVSKSKAVESSPEDKKKWIKEATNAEKKIKLLETDLHELGKLMAEPDFYQRMDAAEIGSKYQQYQKQMEEAFESWEKAQFHLESN